MSRDTYRETEALARLARALGVALLPEWTDTRRLEALAAKAELLCTNEALRALAIVQRASGCLDRYAAGAELLADAFKQLERINDRSQDNGD